MNSLQGLWYVPPCKIDNPLIQFSCSITKLFRIRLIFSNSFSVPLWNNYRFAQNGRPLINDTSKSKGLIILEDMRNPHDGKLRTLSNLLEICANKITIEQILWRSCSHCNGWCMDPIAVQRTQKTVVKSSTFYLDSGRQANGLETGKRESGDERQSSWSGWVGQRQDQCKITDGWMTELWQSYPEP